MSTLAMVSISPDLVTLTCKPCSTGGHIRGKIWVEGHPKVQETFARISGYVEQFDIHSPALTVRESFKHSAQLRLMNVTHDQLEEFVDEVRIQSTASKPSASP